MDAIAAEAEISKPMLYLYYGSKDELFAACIQREGLRFVEAIAPAGDPRLSPREQLRRALEGRFSDFVDKQPQVVAGAVPAGDRPAGVRRVRCESRRERLIELTAQLLESSTKNPEPGTDFRS